MGACASYEETHDPTTRDINQMLKKDHKEDNKVKKLLFLGPGDSGKSTIYKQLVTLYGKGYQKVDKQNYVVKIQANIIHSIQGLIEGSETLGVQELDGEQINCGMSKKVSESVEFLSEITIRDVFTKEVADHVLKVWEDPGIRNTLKLRDRIQFPYDPEYFFPKMYDIIHPDFLPCFEDIIHCRSRTTGILESSLNVNGEIFHVVDVGGQRNERSKWIHCFEDITGMIFVCAISEYDQVLFEDERINRMDEALNLFAEVANSRWFVKKSIIVFLNKCDLFEAKIKRVKFSSCPVFQSYEGPDPPKQMEPALNYLKDLFRSKVQREKGLYIHATCATDTNNINHVFQDIKDIIAREALITSGIL